MAEAFSRAVITGAGSGLGRALALACARHGMRLVLADVDSGGLAQTQELIGAKVPGVEVVTQQVDVSDYEQVENLARLVCERFGGAHRSAGLADTAADSATRCAQTDGVRKAVEAGQISAAQIAEATLEAVEQDRFYVFPHAWVPDVIAARSKAAKLGQTAYNPQP